MLSSSSLLKNTFAYLSIVAATLLTACGGGGGDGATGYPNISYTGSTTAAVIDQGNAADFPFIVLEGSSGTGNIPLAANVESSGSNGMPTVENIEKATGVIAGLIKSNLGTSANLVTGASTSQAGSCGGQVTIIDNSTTSSFNGSIEFNHYCETDASGFQLSLHGKLTISGSYYLDANDSPVFTSLGLTVQYLKITVFDGIETITEEFSGSMTATSFDPVTNEPLDLTITINYKYEGQVYKIVGLQVDESGGIISGTLYNPNHGYVVISTDPADPFFYDSFNEQFCNGTLIITGVDTLANTATIYFTDPDTYCTTYNVCIDANGSVQCSDMIPWGTAPDPGSWYPAP
jgi:hypothetical protein